MTKAERFVPIERKVTSSLAAIKGQVTEHGAVKWFIKKKQATSKSSKPEPAILLRDTSQQNAAN